MAHVMSMTEPMADCPQAGHGCAGAMLCRFARPQGERRRGLARGDALETGGLGEDRALRGCTVRTGLVATSLTTPAGERQILALSGPGEIVSPIWLAAETRTEALAQSDLCVVDLAVDGARLARDAAFWRQMTGLGAAALAAAAARLAALGKKSSTERVADFVLEMAERFGRRGPQGVTLTLSLGREDIADYLGLTTETVSRAFGRLKRDRLVVLRSPTELRIEDRLGLARLAGRV